MSEKQRECSRGEQSEKSASFPRARPGPPGLMPRSERAATTSPGLGRQCASQYVPLLAPSRLGSAERGGGGRRERGRARSLSKEKRFGFRFRSMRLLALGQGGREGRCGKRADCFCCGRKVCEEEEERESARAFLKKGGARAAASAADRCSSARSLKRRQSTRVKKRHSRPFAKRVNYKKREGCCMLA